MHEDAAGRARAVVIAALAEYSARLSALAPAVSADEHDAVHQARVLVRRIRSVLAAYRRLFDRAEVARVRDELAGLGDELGRVRDLEVRVAQAEARLDARVPAAMRRRLVDDVRARHRRAHARLVAGLSSGGPMAAPIDGFLAAQAPARRGEPETRAAVEVGLAGPLVAEAARVRRAWARAGSDLASLHRLRRAARRLRYAVDAVTDGPVPVFGDEARAVSVAAEAVQDLLGAHRDACLFADDLAAIGGDGDGGGGGGGQASIAAYRELAAAVQAEAAARLRGLPAAIDELHVRARVFERVGD
ncbi:CHAD domain-containing protein [Agromyces sp. NPDC055658]